MSALHQVTAPPVPATPGISAAVCAVILIRAAGEHGGAVHVNTLAGHIGCSVDCIRRHCEHLYDHGHLFVQRSDGVDAHLGDINAVASVISFDDEAPAAHH
jgi:hypothetical protein